MRFRYRAASPRARWRAAASDRGREQRTAPGRSHTAPVIHGRDGPAEPRRPPRGRAAGGTPRADGERVPQGPGAPAVPHRGRVVTLPPWSRTAGGDGPGAASARAYTASPSGGRL